jgi:hypothetical protein
MIQPKLKDYLLANGANNTAHSGNTLWDHLAGVHRILRAVDSPDYLCNAGLFHSVYGTQAFQKVTLDATRRPEVQNLIGPQAEALVWAFCRLPRPKLLEVSLQQQTFDWVSTQEGATDPVQFAQDLIGLECANLIEQRNLHPFPYLAKKAQEMRMLDREGFSV